ncbi:MAG: 2Fe-2S iron-sulfur cluster-binding protein [Alphaproteobacteria bacterium]|nr:2Fe-2S iron-sulfur cluster-binding protein [Alphaproteobacteria bacterium]
MKSISLTINGETVTGLVEPRTHLADFMRGQLGLTGTHLGCEQGVCGACTVIIDGQPMRSCISYAVACDGATIQTVEGFDDDPELQDLRTAFSANHALQCGFCTPGMLMTARDIVRRLDVPDTTLIRQELSGNLCRCTGYQGIVTAIASVIEQKQKPAVSNGSKPQERPRIVGPKPFSIVSTQETEKAKEVAVSKLTMAVDAEGWTLLNQSMDVPHPQAKAWAFFEDLHQVAACMPGAQIDTIDGNDVQGCMQIKFGPIRASFDGTAERKTDTETKSGSLIGHGADRVSGTAADGGLTYKVAALDAQNSRVSVEVRFKLTGPLAQFGRSGLVKDFAGRMTTQFGTNMARVLSGSSVETGATGNDLNALSLLWSVLTSRIKSLFGK